VKGSEPPRWLLIGNSRWHWACPDLQDSGRLRVEHTQPAELGADASAALVAWAAVGPVPAGLLPAERRLGLEAVPLDDCPPWLGIDRALAGWQAWRRLGTAVLVADAGTVLSLTRVEEAGGFGGGRLLAGAGLQLRAMGEGTAALPADRRAWGDGPSSPEAWPRATAEAMEVGVLRGLAAAIEAAHGEACRLVPGCRLVLTGGDGPALLPLLHRPAATAVPIEHWPDLALEALAQLCPPPQAQARARSARI